MIGIYKVTNPDGQVYIGQSKNIEKRFKTYARIGKITDSFPPKLKESFIRFGFDNHDFEILEECLFEDLNIRERHYQLGYASIDLGLNIMLQRDIKKVEKLAK